MAMTKAERDRKGFNQKELPKCPRLAPVNSHPFREARKARAKERRGEELTMAEHQVIADVDATRNGIGRDAILEGKA